MPPDPTALAASHDVVQILFWFVVALATAISGGLVWFAKVVIVPVKDGHLTYLAETSKILPTIATSLNEVHGDVKEVREVQKDLADGQKTLAETWRCKFHPPHAPPHTTG